MKKLRSNRLRDRIARFAILSSLIVVALLAVLSIPSHPECGTAGIDYMPCEYGARFIWYLGIGAWVYPAIAWVIANIFYIARARRS